MLLKIDNSRSETELHTKLLKQSFFGLQNSKLSASNIYITRTCPQRQTWKWGWILSLILFICIYLFIFVKQRLLLKPIWHLTIKPNWFFFHSLVKCFLFSPSFDTELPIITSHLLGQIIQSFNLLNSLTFLSVSALPEQLGIVKLFECPWLNLLHNISVVFQVSYVAWLHTFQNCSNFWPLNVISLVFVYFC